MLVIERNAEEFLRAKFDSLKAGSGDFCLWMYRSKVKDFAQLPLDELCRLASPYIIDSDPELCVFGNGDCCLMAGSLSYASIQSICAAIESAVKVDLSDYILPYDLGSQYALVKSIIDSRLKERIQESVDKAKRVTVIPPVDPALKLKIREKRSNHFQPVAMVVEDDAFTRQLIHNALQDLCQAVRVEDGRQTLDLYPMFAPEILFLDIQLPDIIGFEILKWITSVDPEAYVVMLTGNGDRKNIIRSMEGGAKGFIVKPFTRAKLKQYVCQSPHIQYGYGKGKIPL